MIINMTGGGGGGASLNFAVKAYSSEAELMEAVPKENTIGIITALPVTDWIFSATEPEAAAGRVWFQTDKSSPVEFNALKKNSIQVYPTSAKHNITGSWVEVTAKIWQGGEWVEWLNSLYNNGVENLSVLGSKGFYKTAGSGTVTKNANNIVINSGSGSNTITVSHDNAIDLTEFNKLAVEVNSLYSGTDHYQYIFVASIKTADRSNANAIKQITKSGDVTIELDISNVTGSKHVIIEGYEKNLTIKKIWLE